MTAAARVLGAAALGLLLVVPPAGAAIASTTSVTLQSSPGTDVVVGYGQPVVAAAQVSVPGAAPDGWVYFVVDGVSRRTDVAADGSASTTVEGLGTGTHRVSATFVPRDPVQQEGSTSVEVGVEVQRVVPRGALRVTGQRAGRVTAVRIRLRTPYGTEPTGKVRFGVRRLGTAGGRERNVSLEDGSASLVLGRLEAGRYRVAARYGGDAGTEPVHLSRDVRIRRR